MKQTIIALTTAALLTLSGTAAAAWQCDAASSTGWGVGLSPNQSTAARIALDQCARRTSQFDTCYVVRCFWF